MKLTDKGFAIIEGDNYLSAEIEKQGRLDVQREFLMQYRQHIPEGGVVVDVGASLGDTAATFAEMVGVKNGFVFAFEPNPIAFEALELNMIRLMNVLTFPIALGNEDSFHAGVVLDRNNIGASRLSFTELADIPDVEVARLDQIMTMLPNRLDFIKIDAEGWEPLILDGAVETIRRFRPAMLIEVNDWPLGKMGFTRKDIYDRLDAYVYSWADFDGPYGDVLVVAKEKTV